MAERAGGDEHALHVDLTTGAHEARPIGPAAMRAVIGGNGLAALLLARACPAGVEPFDPGNPLVFATSPFVGTGIATAAKVAVATRSPQTGFIGDSMSSSHLALALKRTGFAGLVVQGQAPTASILFVDDERVALLPADDLVGLDPNATAEAVRARLGPDVRVAAIGRAGERRVRFAAIVNDGRLAGRTGTGAVMGAKNLKAIAVRGSHPTRVADPTGLARAARRLAARSRGPATAKYREIGTAANVSFFDRLGILPTRNFQAGRFDGADRIDGETLLVEHRTGRASCAGCTIGCEHRYRTTDAGRPIETRLEYETLFALGSLCGVDDPNVVLRAASLCDRLGIDAISTGATIAWAMECRERGVWLGALDDLPRFGDGTSLLTTIAAIGDRRGAGDLLAEGSRRAAEVVGQGSGDWAMHVKGLEMPGYDPRTLPTLALGLAVGARGACHNRSSAYDVDLSDQLAADAATTARARAAIASEDQATILDSLTVCKFLRHCFDDVFAEAAALHAMVSGAATTGEELRAAGGRIATLKHAFNLRHGWTRADDRLPARSLDGADGGLTLAGLDDLIAAYYRERGWRPDGTLGADHLDRVGLASIGVE